MTASLDGLRISGWLSPLDYHFSRVMSELLPCSSEEVRLGLALASAKTQKGHVCVKLGEVAGRPVDEATKEPTDRDAASDGTPPSWPELQPWLEELRKSPLVGDGSSPTPLVLDAGDRLYLFRYWEHERAVASMLAAKAATFAEHVDLALLSSGLGRLFGSEGEHDAQRDAALVAAFRKLSVITGGPGTGKTHTVARILALLTEQRMARDLGALRTLAIAPTGKAAARLSESIERAKKNLDVSEATRAAISSDARTIHRALGTRKSSQASFVHDKNNPLYADIVLVDETSMVDVALMRRLLEAVPPSARLVLLGDRHQLASVEAGSVLADICGSHPHPGYSPELCAKTRELGAHGLRERAATAPAIVDSIVELTKSHRFDRNSGIAAFARAINTGAGSRARAIAASDTAKPRADLVLVGATDNQQLLAHLEREALPQLGRTLSTTRPARALELLDEYRVLCAHRRGPLGVPRVNERLEAALAREGLITIDDPHYFGRPVMILQNDRALGLFNGDIGVIMNDETGARRAFFRDGQNGQRKVSPVRLPPHETAFAMSIHKSQGSEFSEVAIVLPEPDSPLLTRELLYTAVTRARKRAVLFGNPECIETGATRPVSRASGLERLLHGGE